MKILYFFTVLLCLPLSASALTPNTPAPLIEHLREINVQWDKQTTDGAFYQEIVRFTRDEARIQLHLQLTEQSLRTKNTAHLTPDQRNNRLHHLNVLRAYYQAGIFPQNLYHQKRQPYFVDDYGTACAVGHLVRESGETQLVKNIARENNYAYLAELTAYPTLLAWAETNGFSTDELAWIQPGYNPPADLSLAPVGNNTGANGAITAMRAMYYGGGFELIFAGNFTEIDGQPANGVAAYDGTEWYTFGEGLTGEIREIRTSDNSQIIFLGNFTINDTEEQTRLAVFNRSTNSWSALLPPDWSGEIRDFTVNSGFPSVLTAVGEFTEIGGHSYENIAYLDLSTQTWLPDQNGCRIGTDAPVNSVYKYGQYIYIGGEFTEITEYCDGEASSMETNAFGILNYQAAELFFQPYFGGFEKLDKIHVTQTNIWAFEHRGEETYLHGLYGGVWASEPMYSYLGSDESLPAELRGFVSYYQEDDVNLSSLLYGNYLSLPLGVGYYGSHLNPLSPDNYPITSGIMLPDGSVTAAANLLNKIYFAGDFTEIQGESFAGMAVLDLTVQTSTEEIPAALADDFSAHQNLDNQLIIRYQNLQKTADLHIFSADGKLVSAQQLAAGSGHSETNLSGLPAGAYFYTVTNETGRMSDKFVRVR